MVLHGLGPQGAFDIPIVGDTLINFELQLPRDERLGPLLVHIVDGPGWLSQTGELEYIAKPRSGHQRGLATAPLNQGATLPSTPHSWRWRCKACIAAAPGASDVDGTLRVREIAPSRYIKSVKVAHYPYR
ncbi:hypothetical protein NKDENANG_03540 [Candidatus Entotheonellaceae bacterium PAL068K]